MPKSTVSQRVSELEARLGVRLLQRTTRQLNLTEAGRIYRDHCVRIVAEVELADRAATSLQEAPRGLLRVTVPASTQFLGPTFADFRARFREVQLDVVCTDRSVDLVEESFDLAIRAGTLTDSTLIARNLGTLEYALVASPRHLKKIGRPHSPEGLLKHECLVFSAGPHPKTWRLTRGGQTREVSVTSAVSVNDLDILHDCAVRGLGVAAIPAYRCRDALRAKRLERVLPEWTIPGTPVQAVYPSNRHMSPKVKALLDHLQQMSTAPWSLAVLRTRAGTPRTARSAIKPRETP